MNILFLLSPKIKTSYLESDMTVRQGLEKFKAHGYSAVPVLDKEGYYIGTVSEGDFLKFIIESGNADIHSMESEQIISIIRRDFNPPISIDASLDELLEHLMDKNFAPVIDGRSCFVGIVTRKSVLEYLRKTVDSRSLEWSK